MVIVPADGIKDLSVLTVNAPATEKEAVGCTEGVSEIVKFLKVSVPSLTMDQPVVVIVIVPEDGIKDLSALTVNAPLTEKEAVGWDEGVSSMVNPLNVNVPLLIIAQPVEVIVMVPADGAKVTPLLTVNAPLTEKEAVGCDEGVSEIIKFLNVSVPSLTIDQLVVDIVMVPLEAIKLPLLPTDNVWATVKVEAVVTAAEASIVRS